MNKQIDTIERLIYLMIAFAFLISVSGYLIPLILFIEGKESFNSFTLIALLVVLLLSPCIFIPLIAAITKRDLIRLFSSKPTQ